MTCPVCQRPDLAADLPNCPQCDADLRGLQLVASLRTAPAPVAILPPPRPWGLLAGAAVVLLGSGWLLGHGLGPAAVQSPPPTAAISTTDTVSRAAIIAASDSVKPTVKPKPAPAFVYVVRRGDTLRGIAWRLYGRASLAGRLQAENKIEEPKLLQIGQRLEVFAL